MVAGVGATGAWRSTAPARAPVRVWTAVPQRLQLMVSSMPWSVLAKDERAVDAAQLTLAAGGAMEEEHVDSVPEEVHHEN